MDYWSATNLIKWFFIVIQVTFTLLFIWDAVDNWQTYPSVTSIDIANIDKELFPAVTVCYPNTWKWPGILKLLSKWDKSNFTQGYLGYQDIFFKLGWKRAKVFEADYPVYPFDDMNQRICTLVNGILKSPEGQKQGRFLLNMLGQLHLNNDNFSYTKVAQIKEFDKSWDMSKRWQENKSLVFDDIKSEICQLEYLDCSYYDNVCQSHPGPITYDVMIWSTNFWSSLNALWAFSTFWAPRTLLHIALHNYQHYALFWLNKNISKGYPMHAFDIWHYLKGKYVHPEENMVKAAELVLFLNEFCTEVTKYKCNFMNINQTEMENYLNLIDQPKAHGDDVEDFVLIPFCSFGSDPLKACSSFQKSKVVFQDDTCFTYEHPNEITYKEAKFQFLLNMRENMPHDDKPLSLKVLLHEQGTIPDVLEIDSASQEIYAENDFTKIGITIDSNEVTGTFESMPFEKRNCYLTDEVPNYSRMDCLTRHIFQEAWNVCHCTPWTMGELINDTADYCNITGAICFRKISLETQENIGEGTCPKMCTFKQYKMQTPDHVRFDAFEYGQEYIDYLIENPRKQLFGELQKSTDINDPTFHEKDRYIRENGQAFSMVQFFFHDPQMTVITKDAKVTLADMVSNIGGTIGIFLGLSMLSVLEILIEFSKFIKRKFPDWMKRSKLCKCKKKPKSKADNGDGIKEV